MKRSRRLRGFTLVEAVFAAVLTGMVLTGTLSLFFIGMFSWFRGEGKIQSETQSHQAVRIIANELRQALSVTVDANGNGLSYTLPKKDGTGTDVQPLGTDGVARRIQLDGTNLDMVAAGAIRTVCSNVILTDPLSSGGNQAYQIFVPQIGSVTRVLTVEVVSMTTGQNAEVYKGRNRETIFIRNAPQLNY